MHESPIRVFTPTRPIIRTLDTPRSITRFFSLHTRRIPKERPCTRLRRHRRSRCTVVRLACSVRGAVVLVVLVVLGEDSEGLGGGSRIVTAFSGLDCFAGFDS
jgi:hypothetical protein